MFGEIKNEEMQLSEEGEITTKYWELLSRKYEYLDIDEWVIMPNHLHGIMIINDDCRGGSRTAPTADIIKHKPLGRLIGMFKTVSTKQINIIHSTPGIPVWQRNYYEHIIRNEKALKNIRLYIRANPLIWRYDIENPYNWGGLRTAAMADKKVSQILTKHYGFTDEELEFIINCDIKCRIGQDSQEEE